MVQPVNIPGMGIRNFPDTMSREEIAAVIDKLWAEQQTSLSNATAGAGSSNLPLEDAPTIAAIPASQGVGMKDYGSPLAAAGSADAWRELRDKAGSMLAGTLGTLSTNSPQGRQDIIAKHYPGAKPAQDRWGNPMIEWQGKRYYTSRPGEIDAMDVARTGAGVAGAAPAAAIAPVSIPIAALASGAVAGAQSLGEDAVAHLSGDTTQSWENSARKAALATGIGAAAPLVGPIAMATARPIYRAVAGELFDAAGAPTARGTRILQEAGLTPQQIAILSPQQRAEITRMVGNNFGSAEAAGVGARRGREQEFNVPLTSGELGGDVSQIRMEQHLRGGSKGEHPQSIMREHGVARGSQASAEAGADTSSLSRAQETLRSGVGGGRVNTPAEAGDALAGAHGAANRRAQAWVSAGYEHATDTAEVVRAGGQPRVRVSDFQGLEQRAAAALDAPGRPGREIISTDVEGLAPNARQMVERIRTWEAGQIGPEGTVAIAWDGFDKMRRQLRLNVTAAQEAGNATDINAANAIMRSFDEHFETINPLLGQARENAARRFQTFKPQEDQTPLTKSMLKLMGKDENAIPGAEVTRKLFGTEWKAGEAAEAVQHLLTIHPPGSPGHRAMSEHSLARLFTSPKDGSTLTPRQIVTKIDEALGDRQGEVYRTLLDAPTIARLQRFRDHMETIASSTSLINPSGSGHLVADVARKGASQAGGAAALGWAASILGPVGAAAGGFAGKVAGAMTSDAVNIGRAYRATHPRADIGTVRSGPSSYRGGVMAGPLMDQAREDDFGLLSP